MDDSDRGISPLHRAILTHGDALPDDAIDADAIEATTALVLSGRHRVDQDRARQVASKETAPDLGDDFLLEARATPLHLACYLGHTRAALRLLDAGARPTAKTTGGATPLHYAALHGATELCTRLLDAPRVKVDAPISTASAPNFYDKGVTPLCVAAEHGHADLVRLLLARGADAKVVTTAGCTALFFAARGATPDVTRQLLDAGADATAPTTFNSCPALEAIRRHDAETTRLLLEAGASPLGHAADRWTPSMSAVANPLWLEAMITEQRAIVDALTAHGFTPPPHRSMEDAVRANDLDDVRARLARGDAPAGLLEAVNQGFVEMTRTLLEAGADPNPAGPGYTALHLAAEPGSRARTWRHSTLSYRERCRRNLLLLLEHGADPNRPDRFGQPALWTAMQNRFEEGVELLLAHGARVNDTMREVARGAPHSPIGQRILAAPTP